MKRNSIMAGYYIFYFAAVGIYLPFLPLFLARLDMNSLQIGVLMSVGPLAGIFAQAVWGTLADRYHRRKEYLLIALTLTAIISVSLSFGKGFTGLAVLLLFYALTNSPITALSDALVLNTLEDPRDYGKIRRWGSLGFALTAAFGGLVFSYLDLAWFGAIEGIILFGCLLWAKSLPNPRDTSQAVSAIPFPFLSVVKAPSLVVFLLITFLFMVPYNAYSAFFGWHMQSLGASQWWIGLGWTIAALSEILVFSKGSAWLRRFRPQQLIAMAGLVFTLRWVGYSVVQDYHLIVLLQISQSLSFALFYLAGVEYLNLLLPPYLQGSAQSAFNAVSFGISAIVGTVGAGWLIRVGDVQLMYIISALFTVGGIILALYFLVKEPNLTSEKQE
ncbi:MFS transporter [Desulfosporosinus fructosivorans]